MGVGRWWRYVTVAIRAAFGAPEFLLMTTGVARMERSKIRGWPLDLESRILLRSMRDDRLAAKQAPSEAQHQSAVASEPLAQAAGPLPHLRLLSRCRA